MTAKQRKVVKKWVAALRSGNYRQGKNILRTNEGKYCCLGVLCDLAVKEEIIPPPRREYATYYYGKYGKSCTVLPDKVRKWAGLKTRDGSRPGFSSPSLVELNDDGKRFTTIAKFIESEPEGLFV